MGAGRWGRAILTRLAYPVVGSVLAAAWLSGCSGSSVPQCKAPETVLAQSQGAVLRCSDATLVATYIEQLAARPLGPGVPTQITSALRVAFQAHPSATREQLRRVQQVVSTRATSLDAAALRGHALWLARSDLGPIGPSDGTLWRIASRAVVFVGHDDTTKLALGEADLEAWIRYASLCNEVQGHGPLSLSIAQREAMYRTLKQRFATQGRDEQLALLALAPFWDDVRARWQAAPAAQQQHWLNQLPLSAPAGGSCEQLLSAPLHAHAAALHQAIPDLRVRPRRQ